MSLPRQGMETMGALSATDRLSIGARFTRRWIEAEP